MDYKYHFKCKWAEFDIEGSDDFIINFGNEKADPDVAIKSFKTLQNFVDEPNYCRPGHRNDYVVDTCIYCAMLGIDPEAWLNTLFDHEVLNEADWKAAVEKAEVVKPYLEDYAQNYRVRGGFDILIKPPVYPAII